MANYFANSKWKKRRGSSEVVDFSKWMKWWRFKQIKQFIPKVMCDYTMGDSKVD